MIQFHIQRQSKRSRARLGVLRTPHGDVQTPAFVPVATQAAVKALMVGDVERTGTQIAIVNTYHLHLRPGEQVVEDAGGLHRFMAWDRPLMTDSGGFQVFSLGFGTDLGTGKLATSDRRQATRVAVKQQPKRLKITDMGVRFQSELDGREIFLTPKESIRIQEALGADIMFAFDECPPPQASKAYVAESLVRTHRWAKQSLYARKGKQALYGIVQGGRFADLRRESARVIGIMEFDGFGVGGEFGTGKRGMRDMLRVVFNELPKEKPRHLLGIGHPEDIPEIIKSGVDTFDCIAPTHYARHGYAFTAAGKLNLKSARFVRDQKPLDPKCACGVCRTYSRSYLSHLVRSREISGLSLLTFHNLYFFNALLARLRQEIKKGKL